MNTNTGSIGNLGGFKVIRSSLLPKGTVLVVDPVFYDKMFSFEKMKADDFKNKAVLIKTEELEGLDKWSPEPKKS